MKFPQVVPADTARYGEMGQEYLACGQQVALRRWDERTGDRCHSRARAYETVGYLIEGKMELEIDSQTAIVDAGDSWLVPAGARHTYRVIQDIVAIEATAPPARQAGRDDES